MGDIDEHSQTVHFSDHFPAERAQSSPTFCSCTGVTDLIVCRMAKGHISDSLIIVLLEFFQRCTQRRTVFQTDEDREQPFLLIQECLIRGLCIGCLILVCLHCDIETLQKQVSISLCLYLAQRCRDIYSKERPVDSSSCKFRKIDVGVIVVKGQVPESQDLRRCVAMRVKDKHYFTVLCLTASYISTAAATETLREVISPDIGMAAFSSASSSILCEIPFPSDPIMMAQGPVISTS